MAEDTTTPKTQVAKVPLSSGGKLLAIVPQNIDEAYRLAGIIAASGSAPKSYEGNQNRIMVGILQGAEVGLPPLSALQSIAVINGMPSVWGDGALALVQSSGKLEGMEESVEGEGKDAVAICRLKRNGKEWIEQRFSMKDAEIAGLSKKPGPWQQYPKRMLTMRARSWAMRNGFADVLRGLSVREEVEDMIDVTPAGPTPPRPVSDDYVDVDAEPVETFDLLDQFGTGLGSYPAGEYAENFQSYLLKRIPSPGEGVAFLSNNEDSVNGAAAGLHQGHILKGFFEDRMKDFIEAEKAEEAKKAAPKNPAPKDGAADAADDGWPGDKP